MTSNSQRPMKVFVVDPDGRSVANMLEKHACRVDVRHFSSGREALRVNPSEHPQMWILHMRLPDMSGIQLRQMLWQQGCRATIALMSDDYQANDEREARQAGAALYFAKPFLEEAIELAAA